MSRDDSQALSKIPLDAKVGGNVVWPFNDNQTSDDSMFRPMRRKDKFDA